eukprot:scaffold1386_cov55-Attheya_sp.AAC.4
MTETPILAVDRISDEGKYSEAYFKQRIEDLKKIIQLPKICPFVKETFITACQSVQYSTTSLKKSQAVVDKLIKNKVDDDTLKTAKEAVDAAQTVVDGANLLAKRTARPALEEIFSATGSKIPMVDEESLLQCVILIQSTPKGLADFCDQNPDVNCPLVEQLLSCPTQMKSMIVNGGASCGNYGPALLILDTLDKQMASAYETVPELYRKLAYWQRRWNWPLKYNYFMIQISLTQFHDFGTIFTLMKTRSWMTLLKVCRFGSCVWWWIAMLQMNNYSGVEIISKPTALMKF